MKKGWSFFVFFFPVWTEEDGGRRRSSEGKKNLSLFSFPFVFKGSQGVIILPSKLNVGQLRREKTR